MIGLANCRLQLNKPGALVLSGENVLESWRKWFRSFQRYLEATGFQIADDRQKVAVFLNLAGDEAEDVLDRLKLVPNCKVDYDDYERMVEIFENYCATASSSHSRMNNARYHQRFCFFNRSQSPKESINSFVTDLKRLAQDCYFGDQQESLICDRIIGGIQDNNVREQY